jgi:RHS repeat-associated protein
MKIIAVLILVLHVFGWSAYSNTQQERDHYGRLSKETFPNGKSIEISYDEFNRVIALSIEDVGHIFYKYDDAKLVQVSRVSPSGQYMYTHSYEYDSMKNLLREYLIADLGQIVYNTDINQGILQITSPYSEEICRFNPMGLIDYHCLNGKLVEYDYDNHNQLVSLEVETQIPSVEYDQYGNLIKKVSSKGRYELEFDPSSGKLIGVITDVCQVRYFYDNLDRRVAKRTQWQDKEEIETYLYFGNNEIAVYEGNGSLKQLRVPGLSFADGFILPIAIETKDGIYAAIHDYRGNLSRLIDAKNREMIAIPAIEPFGQNLDQISSPTPWVFSSKHYDSDTQLVYFGGRYYDPELKQWIAPDPLGTLQHPNPYLYCFGNPLFYFDPNGEAAISLVNLAWGAGAVLTFPVWGSAALFTAAGAAAGWAAYEVVQKVKEGNQRDGTPRGNHAQNDQFKDARKQIERMIGRKISKDEERRLHREISGKNFGYHDMVEYGYWLFHGK